MFNKEKLTDVDNTMDLHHNKKIEDPTIGNTHTSKYMEKTTILEK